VSKRRDQLTAKDVNNLSTPTKKHKAKKKKYVETTPGVIPVVPVTNVDVTTEVGRSAVILPFDKVIKDLETKLRAKYEHDLAQYKKENGKVVVSNAAKAMYY
jgi:hypothetical protein